MSYYIKYSPPGDVRYLPQAWAKEEYFEIILSDNRGNDRRDSSESKGVCPVSWSETDMIEKDVIDWYVEHGGEMTDFDREFLARLRKEEAEGVVAVDMKAIEKTYRVNLARTEMEENEQRELWKQMDATVGRWVPFEGKPGGFVWENYKEGEGGGVPVKKEGTKKVAKKKQEVVASATPKPAVLPITRVEVTLGGKDIVIELTSASDISTMLEDLQKVHGFSEKMKKKLDALLVQNKPT
jgi:hypothetical protein